MTQTEIIVGGDLTPDEQSLLTDCENRIERGLSDAVDAMRIIRNCKLYRQHGTWEQYCQTRWAKPRQVINRMIQAATIEDELEQIGSQMEHESWAKHLAQLPTIEDKQTALHLAKLTAPAQKVTAEHLKSTVKVVQDLIATGHVDLADGSMTTIQAAINTETQERLARKAQHIQDKSEWEYKGFAEMPAQLQLAIEKAAAVLIDVDQGEMIKVVYYVRK
jgi:hypothetical protein